MTFFVSDKAEWLEDIERGESSLASYLACIDECISERECRKFEEGRNWLCIESLGRG